MAERPSLLFISPVMPAVGGNGLAMRMGVFLEAYARHFAVTLIVVPVTGEPFGETSLFIRRHAQRCIVLPLDRVLHPLFQLIARHRDPQERRRALRSYPRPRPFFYDPVATRELIEHQLEGQSFALVHAGRVYMAPLAQAYAGKAYRILDLDEDDARTLQRIANLRRLNGTQAAGDDEAADARKYEALMDEYLKHFDLGLVASEQEEAHLRRRYPGVRLAVIANAIRPASPAEKVMHDELHPIDFLMVGTMGYYPNADGALFFCREILPRIGQAPGKAHETPNVTILGSRPPSVVMALAEDPAVSVVADAADVAPYYAAARVAVVPLRAGGGSRIKILEAFAHGRPVISTSIGAEGLAVADGRHLLIADSAEDFAAAARRLLAEPELGDRLVAEARELVAQRYDLDRVASQIEALADQACAMIECAGPGAAGSGEPA